jgi:hypothetical protein
MDGRSKASRPERPALEHGVAESDWEEGGSFFHIPMSVAEYSESGRRLEVKAAEKDPQEVKLCQDD